MKLPVLPDHEAVEVASCRGADGKCFARLTVPTGGTLDLEPEAALRLATRLWLAGECASGGLEGSLDAAVITAGGSGEPEDGNAGVRVAAYRAVGSERPAVALTIPGVAELRFSPAVAARLATRVYTAFLTADIGMECEKLTASAADVALMAERMNGEKVA